MIITSKKEKIIKDLKEGLRNVDISKKYDVEPSYVSHIIKELEIQKQLQESIKIESFLYQKLKKIKEKKYPLYTIEQIVNRLIKIYLEVNRNE